MRPYTTHGGGAMTQGRGTRRKLRVGVLFGGQSSEHAVSIASARSVIAALDRDTYEVVPVGITRNGQWLTGGDPMQTLLEAGGQLTATPPPIDEPDNEPGDTAATGGALAANAAGGSALVPGPEGAANELHRLDVIFPVLHGPRGEDGTVQGFLELMDIAYVGSGVLASAVGMDKWAMKAMLRDAGLPTPRAVLVRDYEWRRDPQAARGRIAAQLGFPCFVKPANMGSSVGVSKAHDAAELDAAMHEAFRYDRRVLVEEAVIAREVECSVLGNDEPETSAVGEIVIGGGHEFYDYEAKYTDANTTLNIPAKVPEHIADEVRRLAVAVFRAVDAAGLARVDCFYDEANDRVLVNEINTIPGFTSTSMYASMWAAVGVGYGELVDRLVTLALERHAGRHR